MQAAMLQYLLPKCRLFIDIGAGSGKFSLMAKQAGVPGVIAMDRSPINVALMGRRLRRHGFDTPSGVPSNRLTTELYAGLLPLDEVIGSRFQNVPTLIRVDTDFGGVLRSATCTWKRDVAWLLSCYRGEDLGGFWLFDEDGPVARPSLGNTLVLSAAHTIIPTMTRTHAPWTTMSM